MTQVLISNSAHPPTREEIQSRISLLADEMDCNDQENSTMQAEIDELYRRADEIPAPADREALLARANLLADEMDANDEENRSMQEELDGLYVKMDSITDSPAEAPGS